MNKKVLMLFSGHNDRAVIALCRFFKLHNLEFIIIAVSDKDKIFNTSWKKNVIFTRTSKHLNIELFKKIRETFDKYNGTSLTLNICQTSEFLNQFILEHKKDLEVLNITSSLPDQETYNKLTNKLSSKDIINEAIGITAPPQITFDKITYPCVFKPKQNIVNGKIYYPIICNTEQDLINSTEKPTSDNWFLQKFINGQSYYLCAYINKSGDFASCWQQNLIQQPNGKSIVLAKICENPGINESNLFRYIKEIGYFGLFMMEILVEENNLYFIEINPRFWGPLQLAIEAEPRIMYLFLEEINIKIKQSAIKKSNENSWYAWAKGAESPKCKKYPALAKINQKYIDRLIKEYDIYNREDTILLHYKH